MRLVKWDKLPPEMQTEEVKKYYDILKKKRLGLIFKRLFDIVVSFTLLLILSPIFLFLAIAIKIDSKGPVFFRQERITQFGKKFRIFKFRSMVADAPKMGSEVTVKNDMRITRMGKIIRKCRLDEISQLIDVLRGKMTFVGTRPEVEKYVKEYTPEMWATLLLPAGITSECSILYKDEDELLNASSDVDKTYVEDVLPGKMYYNLKSIENFSFWRDLRTMVRTVFAMLGKDYQGGYKKEDQAVAQEDENG